MSSVPISATRRARLMREMDRVGCSQRGLITAAQLDALDLGRSGRHWALVTGRVTRVRQGVYLLAGVPPAWETMVLAAVLAAGPAVVASHVTVGRLWGILEGRPPDPVPPAIHLISPKVRRHDGVIVHRQRLTARDRARRSSIPLTSPARTLFDLSSMLDADGLGRSTDEALRRGLLDLAHLRRTYDEHGGGGRRGLGPLRQVLSERIVGFDPGANDWERRMDELWDELGLPTARRQYVIVTRGGRYRVDRAVVDLRLAVEWAGNEFHGQRGRYSRDRLRISDLVQAGWDVVEVTPNWTPERVRRTVLAKVAQRARAVRPPPDGAARQHPGPMA